MKFKLETKNDDLDFNLSAQVDNTEPILSEVEGYYSVPFRLISTGIIRGHWIGFSEDVLKEAIPMFVDLMLHTDHEAWTVKDWLGKVTEPIWKEAVEGKPSGINGMVNINLRRDAATKGDIALAVKEGIIKSGSMGFRAKWERSHKSMKPEEFEKKLGTVVNDLVVHRVITKITNVEEFSLVHTPADPFAQRQDTLSKVKIEEDNTQDPETGEEDVMLEKIKKMLGLPDAATDVEVEAALSKILEGSAAYRLQLDGIRDTCKAQMNIITMAKADVPKAFIKMILSDDAEVLHFANEELTKLAKATIPAGGKSSETPDPNPPKEENKDLKPTIGRM